MYIKSQFAAGADKTTGYVHVRCHKRFISKFESCNLIYVCEECFQLMNLGKGKGKFRPITGHEGPDAEYRYSSTTSLTLELDGGGWSTPRPDRFNPEKDTVPIVYEAGWAPEPVWTVRKFSPPHPTGIRSPDHPARSESLYRLPSPGLSMNQEVQKSSSECLVKYCNEDPFYSIIGCHRTVTHLCVADQNTRSSIPGSCVIRLWNEDGVHHGGGTVHVFHSWTKVYWIQWWQFIYLYSNETNSF